MNKRFNFLLLSFALVSCGSNVHASKYKITWQDDQGNILYISEYNESGMYPTYPGGAPSKPAGYDFTYIFNGWSPSIERVKESKTYTANFTKVSNYETTMNLQNMPYNSTVTFDSDYNVNVYVDWGDGTINNLKSHTYSQSASTARIRTIDGHASTFRLSNSNGLFSSGNAYIQSITLSDRITDIGSYSFKGCTGLTSINMPSSLKTIGDSAFAGCTNLSSINNLSQCYSLDTIGRYAFENTRLNSLTIPSNVSKIMPGILYNCSSISYNSLDFKNTRWNIIDEHSSSTVVTNFYPDNNKNTALDYLKNVSYVWTRAS